MRFFFLFIISFIVVSANDFLFTFPTGFDSFSSIESELEKASAVLDNIKDEINSYVITREGNFRLKSGFQSWVILRIYLAKANDLYCNPSYHISPKDAVTSLKYILKLAKKESNIQKALYDKVPSANRIEFYGTADANFIKDATKLINSSLACAEDKVKQFSSPEYLP